MQKREDKLQKKRAEKCASIDADSSAKRISGRSVKIISNQRRDAWNEIFDVLLWSVSFATKSFDKKEGINEHSSDALGFSISNKLDILDTTKAMPQLIRPQDLANVVQALFHQLLPVEKRMSREDFIECMETFTAGHGFVHNAKNANSVIMEQLLMGAGSNSSSLGNPDQNGLLRSKSSDRLSFMSREFSFSSTAAREDGKASSASAIEQRERALARLNSNATDGSAKSAGVVAPNTFPINMLLNSNNNSMSGQIKNMNVAAEHVVSNRGARNKSSERRVVSASEKLGNNQFLLINAYIIANHLMYYPFTQALRITITVFIAEAPAPEDSSLATQQYHRHRQRWKQSQAMSRSTRSNRKRNILCLSRACKLLHIPPSWPFAENMGRGGS